MAFEWIAPIGAVLAAGFGGWLGGRQSRRNQDRQHRFDRERDLVERGRAKLDEALSALPYLQPHAVGVAEWDNSSPREVLDEIQKQRDRLGQVIPYLADSAARRDIKLIFNLAAASLPLPEKEMAELNRIASRVR